MNPLAADRLIVATRALGRVAAERAVDAALVAGGIGLATASGVFGLYMVLHAGGEPRINGREHFTVFAQLKGVPLAKPVVPQRPLAPAPAEIDPVVTGALGSGPLAEVPAPPVRRLSAFRVASATEGRAEIEAAGRTWRVETGAMTPLFGRVLSIRREPRGWVVETENGSIEEQRPSAAD